MLAGGGGRREKNRFATMMMKPEEEEKENVGAGAVGALQGSRLLPLSRPQPLSDVEDYTTTPAVAARRHHPHNFAHSTPSFLPDILGSNKCNRGQTSSPSQLAPFWTYAAGHGGSVEHWKKLARKAELEMHLEQEHHKSDREKDLDSIHRLRSRISVLEAAAIDRDMMIEKQRRKISLLKSQIGGVNKILELKEELLHSESKTKLLENQLGLIYKCIEEPLEMFNLTELHERAPESVQQLTSMKSSRRGWKKQGGVEADETAEGFDDFTMSKGDRQIGTKGAAGSNLIRKRQAKNSMAGKILQLRAENSFLSKQVEQRNERLKSLFHEAEHLRKQFKEAVVARNSALCQVRESERLFEKLEAMEPLIVKAGIVNEQDVACERCNESINFTADKGGKPTDQEMKQKTKDGNMLEEGLIANSNELQVNSIRLSRKQAFKKWAIILSKIRSALLVFLSKVHATNQLESRLMLEKDSLNSLVHKLQREVLTDLDSEGVHSMMEMEKLRGEEQIDEGKDVEIHTRTIKVDRELTHKILTAVRAQKRKLVVTTGRVEDLKKERVSSEAVLFNKQKKISELEKRLEVAETAREILSAHFTCLSSMLAHIEDFSVSTGQERENTLKVSNASSHMRGGHEALATQFPEAADIEIIVRKVQSILDEREERNTNITQAQAEKEKLCEELTILQDGLKLFGVIDHDKLASSENLGSQLRQFKVRKDELEVFYEQCVSWHRSITKNLQILQSILTEGLVHDNKMLLGLDYGLSKSADKSLLQESFKKVVSCIPDMVLKVNLLSIDRKEYDSNLRKADLKRKEAESEVAKQCQLLDAYAGVQKELDEAKKVLEEIYNFVNRDKGGVGESRLVGSIILEQLHKMAAHAQDNTGETRECKQRIEVLSTEISTAQGVSVDALQLVNSLRQDLSGETTEEFETVTSEKLQKEQHRENCGKEPGRGISRDSESSLNNLLYQLKACLQDVQSLRKAERMRMANDTTSLKQKLETANEQLERHVKHSLNASTNYNEKIQSLSEEIVSIKAEKELLLAEISTSSARIREFEHSLQKLQHGDNAQIAVLQGEKVALIAEVKNLNAQSQGQALLYEQSRKELTNTIEALKAEVLNLKSEHTGSKDSAEELRRMVSEGKSIHEQSLKEWEIKRRSLEEQHTQLQHEINRLVTELQILNDKLQEKESMIENMTKASLQQAESLKLELTRVSCEQAGSGNEISKLQTLLKERDLAAAEAASQISQYIKGNERLSEENSEMQQKRLRLVKQLEHLQQVMNNNDTLYKNQLKSLAAEVSRLGGPDITDEVERSKRQAAAEREKDLSLNPLRKLAIFQVALLVNTKAHKQLEVSGINGGLTQAAVHYFTISQQFGEITFEKGNAPGSQSSNMLAELMLLSGNDTPIYETKAGDILGLSVKVKGLNDKNPREILYNTSVIRTDEVMEAIKGQPIDNFSLWPDLVSSWKWERSASKGWVLVCVKWRFLFKNIFPEISEPLQVLSIKHGS